MTASTASCLVGRGDSAWLEALELRRPFWAAPSIDELAEGDGGWPRVLGGGVGKVW